MYIKYLVCVSIVLACCTLIFGRMFHLIFVKRNREPKAKSRPVRTMIILGSGGHTAEMLRIVKHLDIRNYSPRVYIRARTDGLSIDKVKDMESDNKDYKILEIYRSREMTEGSYMVTVPWEPLLEESKNIPVEIRLFLMSTINVLQRTSDKQLISDKWISATLTTTDACLDRTWEYLNTGRWKDIPIEHRYCYTLCTVVKVVLMSLGYRANADKFTDKEKKVFALREIVSEIDKGILMGAPLPSVPNLLTAIASKLNNYWAEESEITSLEEIQIDDNKIDFTMLSGFSEVERCEKPSMESFYRDIFKPKRPTILTGCMKHWKALTLWKNLNYLRKIAGSRTVPIEIGSKYTEEDWTEQLVNFSEFLLKYIVNSSSQVGYLAQHQFFEQIPELKDDFTIPEYCYFSDSQENDAMESPDINAWFGPGSTISPLHFDPKNNLLSQVFGYKRIILYHPDETNNLYRYDTELLDNTAQVDPINPDYDKWPNFRKAKGIMCYLKPGEMLYIPPKWWHHVTALTPSFSISFWWN